MRMDQHMADAQRDIIVLKETVKRLDLGVYRLHGNAKANQEVVRKVQGQVKDMAGVKATVRRLRKEVDNLLFQLPVGKDTGRRFFFYNRLNGTQLSTGIKITVDFRCMLTDAVIISLLLFGFFSMCVVY